MFVVRPIKEKDLDDVLAMASKSHGMTNLPADQAILQQRILESLNSFQKDVIVPENEVYFFVLEDVESNKVIGTSAIEAQVGMSTPFYSYKMSFVDHVSQELHVKKHIPVLHLVNDYRGVSELCSLFIAPDHRHAGLARLLSFSRFLFIAEFKQRFAKKIIADMRGVSDASGQSPFWHALGGHFFAMDFSLADYLSAATNKQFIADLMPKYPIYVPLLSAQAVEVIGQPHKNTERAMRMLEHIGFKFRNYVDIFDAGPTLECSVENIHPVRNSEILGVDELGAHLTTHTCLVSNTELDFRATLVNHQNVSQACACLGVQKTDEVRVLMGAK